MRISDWSSDVFSSDLSAVYTATRRRIPTSRREKSNVVEGLDVSPPLRPLASALLELVRALRRTSRRPSRLVRSYRPTGASLFLSSENMPQPRFLPGHKATRSEENTSELQSLMRIS